ncbi:hypothetical protein [Oceanobacillus profundus]|uniref:hypothetical protein n=1 Tax=Oceanobacillus profundus TaxID=372463 RepID=UPI003624B2FF
MKLTRKFKIPHDENVYSKFRKKQMESGIIWSDIVQYANNHLSVTEHELYKMTQKMNTLHSLHSQTVQAIVQNYVKARKTTLERRKNGDIKVKAP